MAFAQRMKMKNVRISGVQVLTHLRPTFGCTISSRTYRTTASRALMNPVGTGRPDLRYRRTTVVTRMNTKPATSHSMKTCLVTEKSIPAIVGR